MAATRVEQTSRGTATIPAGEPYTQRPPGLTTPPGRLAMTTTKNDTAAGDQAAQDRSAPPKVTGYHLSPS
jgi:hypothetical protein